jgi:transcriptional regulator with XRE-family HTH domain
MPITTRPINGQDLCSLILSSHNMSLRALARRVGVAPATACGWLDGRVIPTDSHGLTLAALAGVDPVAALVGLQLARTDCPESRALWRTLWVAHSRAGTGVSVRD